MKQNCGRSLRQKITKILYTDGHNDTDIHRQADFSIPTKTFVLLGYNGVFDRVENNEGKGENAG